MTNFLKSSKFNSRYSLKQRTNVNQPQKKFKHIFVPVIPDVLEENTLYICLKYNTMLHKCACGCGEEVVTPISPNDWSFTYNGESVSLSPSIGNWSYRCRSHYWIIRNTIIWAEQWSDEKVKRVRELDNIRTK